MKLVVDTNALLLPFRGGPDIKSEIERLLGAVEWLVPSPVLIELQSLASATGAGPIGETARAAVAAQRLAKPMQEVATELPGDDGVLDVARRHSAAVLTDDKRLMGEAKRSGLTVVRSRGHGLAIA